MRADTQTTAVCILLTPGVCYITRDKGEQTVSGLCSFFILSFISFFANFPIFLYYSPRLLCVLLVM